MEKEVKFYHIEISYSMYKALRDNAVNFILTTDKAFFHIGNEKDVLIKKASPNMLEPGDMLVITPDYDPYIDEIFGIKLLTIMEVISWGEYNYCHPHKVYVINLKNTKSG